MTTNPATRPFWVFVGSELDVKEEAGKSELTELKARDASCPKGKKMGRKMNRTIS